MNIVKDALSKMELITGQIKELDRRFKAEEISGVDYQAQKAELGKQLEAKINAFDSFVGSAMSTLRTPDSLSAAMFQDGKYTPAVCTESE